MQDIITFATPLKDVKGWETGEEYGVYVTKFSDSNRVAIFKKQNVGESGYTVFENLQELEKCFKLTRG